MIRPIIAYGDPILNLKVEKIKYSESNSIDSLINDLWDTMYNANGVGIAAPQIGVSKSIFVADFSFFEDEDSFHKDELINIKQVFINPKIIKESGDDFTYSEGCLSIPNISEEVIRKEKIKINFLNETTLIKFKLDTPKSLIFPGNTEFGFFCKIFIDLLHKEMHSL